MYVHETNAAWLLLLVPALYINTRGNHRHGILWILSPMTQPLSMILDNICSVTAVGSCLTGTRCLNRGFLPNPHPFDPAWRFRIHCAYRLLGGRRQDLPSSIGHALCRIDLAIRAKRRHVGLAMPMTMQAARSRNWHQNLYLGNNTKTIWCLLGEDHPKEKSKKGKKKKVNNWKPSTKHSTNSQNTPTKFQRSNKRKKKKPREK